MTTPPVERQEVKILSEVMQTTFPRPGEAVIVWAITYQPREGPPRTLWIEESALPDRVFLRANPASTEAPREAQVEGDRVRAERIRADLARRQVRGTGRSLTI